MVEVGARRRRSNNPNGALTPLEQEMANVSLRDLLEAGVHFGHQTRLWNPKMKPYIYGEKNGIHIIDIQKTASAVIEATRYVSATVARGGTVLFVGTKRASQEIIEEQAVRSGMFFVNNRWLGGTLTNFQTVKKSIDRLVGLERARDEGKLELLTKKEALDITRRITKMDKSLGGIKTMKGLPKIIFVVDPRREHIAIREANKLGIPVVALCDTNCDPQGIDNVIPGNDDAIKSIRLFTTAIADAVIEGNALSRTGQNEAVASQVDMGDVEIYRRGTSPEEEGEVVASDDSAAETAETAETAE
jgi:small subunit ribosomal protein S2